MAMYKTKVLSENQFPISINDVLVHLDVFGFTVSNFTLTEGTYFLIINGELTEVQSEHLHLEKI